MVVFLAFLAGLGIGGVAMALYRDRYDSHETHDLRQLLANERLRYAQMEARLLTAYDAGKIIQPPDTTEPQLPEEPLPGVLLEFLSDYEDLDARMVWAKRLQRELNAGKSPSSILRDIEAHRGMGPL